MRTLEELVEEKKDLYKQMADLTKPKCATCKVPYSCCSPEYCQMALNMAKEYGVEIKTTDHPTLPLMGKDGCIIDPYLRPLCTLHQCTVNALGFIPADKVFNKEYNRLRAAINSIDYAESKLKTRLKSQAKRKADKLAKKRPKSKECYPQRTLYKVVINQETGETKEQDLTDWAKELGMNLSTLHRRIHRSGWPIEKCLSLPVDRRNNKGENKFQDEVNIRQIKSKKLKDTINIPLAVDLEKPKTKQIKTTQLKGIKSKKVVTKAVKSIKSKSKPKLAV